MGVGLQGASMRAMDGVHPYFPVASEKSGNSMVRVFLLHYCSYRLSVFII